MNTPHQANLPQTGLKEIFSLMLIMQLPSLAPAGAFILSLMYPMEPWLGFACIAISLLAMEYLLTYYKYRTVFKLASYKDKAYVKPLTLGNRARIQLHWLLPMVAVWCVLGVTYTFASGFWLLLWWVAVLGAAGCTMLASFLLSFSFQK